MKLSSRKQLTKEATVELQRLRKLAGLNESRLNEAVSVMPTVAKIRDLQKDLEHLDKWLRGEPGYFIRNDAEFTSMFRRIEKSVDDIKKVSTDLRKELKTRKK